MLLHVETTMGTGCKKFSTALIISKTNCSAEEKVSFAEWLHNESVGRLIYTITLIFLINGL